MNTGTLLLSGLTALLALASHAADVAGQWRSEFDTQISRQKYAFTFQTDGDKLTGIDKRRDDIPRGKLEMIEYEPKTVGANRSPGV